MRDLTTFELGWLSGILEGEGCFTTTGRRRPYVAVYVQSTDRDVVERAADMIEAGVQTSKHISEISVKPQYRTVVQGRKASEVMQAVRPHMGSRRAARIDELLGLYEAANGGRLELSS